MGSNGQLGQSTDEEDAWEPGTMLGKQLEQRKVMAVSGGGQHTVLIAQGTCFLFVWMHANLCFYWRSWAWPLKMAMLFKKKIVVSFSKMCVI